MASLQAKQKWAIEDVSAFAKFFHSLSNKLETTFQVFDHGGFYSTHGKHAILAAKHIFKATSAIKILDVEDTKLETVYLGRFNFEALARDLLLVLQYRLEVWKFGSDGKWFIQYKASPGNLLEVEDLLFNNMDLRDTSSAVVAVRYLCQGNFTYLYDHILCSSENPLEQGYHQIGPRPIAHNWDEKSGQLSISVGYVDTSSAEIKYAEFPDNQHFSNLEATIIQLGPKECIVTKLDSSLEAVKLREVIKRSKILLTERPKSDFSSKNMAQDMKRLHKRPKKNSQEAGDISPWISQHETSASCVAALVLYLSLLDNEENFGQYSVEKYDLARYMRLDSAAVSALNLFSVEKTSVAQQGRAADSLFAVLNRCQTHQGQRLLSRWIKQPLLDISHLEERLGAVEAFVECTELRQLLSTQILKKLPDFDRMSKKFLRKKANLQDCYRIYMAIKELPYICDCIEKHSESLEQNHSLLNALFTSPLHEVVNDFRKFLDMVDTTLDFEMVKKHEFMVKPDFDPELQRLRNKMDEIEKAMNTALIRAASDLDLEAGKTIKLELASQFGHVFRITCKEEKKLRTKKNFTTLDTNKTGVKFVNSRLQCLSMDNQELRQSYEKQQHAVVEEIVTIATGYAELMQSLGDLIAKLDVLVSYAQVSVSAPTPYVRPVLRAMASTSNRLKLVQCRHPCVEQQDAVSFIPNDATLEKQNHDFIIVTGPNMGGKSTYIRQIGVAVLMAQIGCFVPCDEAEVCMFDAILARVGAGDCQVEGISTFMAEMLETASILRSATDNSLVIIDELGRGTSTYDGFGLAWAISHHIAVEIKASCLFATHFHEMTSLADEVSSVVNYHVTALTGKDDVSSSLTMLYEVKPGSCDRSFGIHVAECVDFPRHVVDEAKRKADELEDYFVAPSLQGLDPKKRRKVKKEGEEVIQEFLQAVEATNWEGLSESDIQEKMEALKTPVRETDNPYIKDLLKKLAAKERTS